MCSGKLSNTFTSELFCFLHSFVSPEMDIEEKLYQFLPYFHSQFLLFYLLLVPSFHPVVVAVYLCPVVIVRAVGSNVSTFPLLKVWLLYSVAIFIVPKLYTGPKITVGPKMVLVGAYVVVGLKIVVGPKVFVGRYIVMRQKMAVFPNTVVLPKVIVIPKMIEGRNGR